MTSFENEILASRVQRESRELCMLKELDLTLGAGHGQQLQGCIAQWGCVDAGHPERPYCFELAKYHSPSAKALMHQALHDNKFVSMLPVPGKHIT